jgi:CRISPR-associated protein Cas8a1/Csx13
MGKRKSGVTTNTPTATEQSLTWRLSDPGMDLLERAGLAGLYMALQAATESGADLSPLSCRQEDLKPDSVTVRWVGLAKTAFSKLMEWAWQVRDGVLYLPAVHGERERAAIRYRVPLHSGIMRTFLQHVNTQPKLDAVTRIIELDENKTVSVTFEPPAIRVDDNEREINPKTDRPYKKKIAAERVRPHEDMEKLFDRTGCFASQNVSLSNWVYPGIAGRYGEEESWNGPATMAMLLMLAPTVCLYQRLQGEGNNWVFVLPDIRDLKEFAETRVRMNLDATLTDVASLGDAGLQFLAEYSTRSPRQSLGSGCRVVAMGYVRYYQGQSIRKAVLDVPPELLSVKRYRILHREMRNTYEVIKPRLQDASSADGDPKGRTRKLRKATEPEGNTPSENGYIRLPSARGRIADNLTLGRPWYTDISVPLIWNLNEAERARKKLGTSIERAWFQIFCYQRSKLMKLIAEDDIWDTEAEKVFVEAFWEMLDSLYAQEADATKRGGSRTAVERFDDLNEDIRRRLTQAKTRTLLRAALTDLLAKAGRQRSIRAHPAAIWRLIDDPKQRMKGRDLALLALASHRKKEDRESVITSTTEQGT